MGDVNNQTVGAELPIENFDAVFFTQSCFNFVFAVGFTEEGDTSAAAGAADSGGDYSVV